tara:strand:- start:2173 stop:2499 length:327 start_codon:yes stop_codon:yes gene_type:complete
METLWNESLNAPLPKPIKKMVLSRRILKEFREYMVKLCLQLYEETDGLIPDIRDIHEDIEYRIDGILNQERHKEIHYDLLKLKKKYTLEEIAREIGTRFPHKYFESYL